MDIPLKTIEAVVNNQFEEAHKALKDNCSIELSGLCKFLFNKKKAGKEFERQLSKEAMFRKILSSPDLTEQKRRSTELKLASTLKWMDGIKPKLVKYGIIKEEGEPDSGGMEEQTLSGGKDEGVDRPDLSGEKEDM